MTNFKNIVIGLMIGGIITAMAVQIHNQTRLIASQSDELDRQQEENAKLMEAAGMQSEGTNSEHEQMMRHILTVFWRLTV